jgi:hypothetical protein
MPARFTESVKLDTRERASSTLFYHAASGCTIFKQRDRLDRQPYFCRRVWT